MSEDSTSKLENAQALYDSLLKTERADEGLVDRTQQLINEVNQLLGSSDSPSASPVPPVAETPPMFEMPALPETPPVSETPAVLETPAVPPQEPAEVLAPTNEASAQTPNSEETVEDASDSTNDSAATLRNFLDSLVSGDSNGTDEPNEPALNSPQIEAANVQADTESLQADVENLQADVENLQADMPSISVEADSAEIEEISYGTNFENVVDEPEVPAVEEFNAEGVEASSAEVPHTEVPVEPVAATESPIEPELENEPALESEDEEETFFHELNQDAEEEQSITQKYLDELRTVFDDEPEQTKDSEQVQDIDSELQEDDIDDPDVPSVESWLAANVSQSTAAVVEDVVEEEVAAENEDAVATVETFTPEQEVAAEDVANIDLADAEASDVEAEAVSELDADSEVAFRKVEPTVAFDSQNDNAETGSVQKAGSADLPTSFESRFDGLENRISEMFATLKSQIELLGKSGFAAAQSESGFADESVDGNDDEPESPTSESEGESQPNPEDETVESLKTQLKSKLREAEMELSINRAKLSQQKASIEQMQADLERREAAVDAKLERVKKSAGSAGDKKGLMDRWKRHLGE